MKVLFVCWRNVSRSQMAAAYYNAVTNTNDADSAGTQVEVNGETLTERRNRVGGTVAIELARREGWDISQNRETQLTPEMLWNYDIIVSMASPLVTPDWLGNYKDYVYWDVSDPGASSLGALADAFEVIKRKVDKLIASQLPNQKKHIA